jgi:hypothetical protein
MGKDQRWQIYVGIVADIDIKILGVPHPGPGMPFLDSDTCAEGKGGGGDTLQLGEFIFENWKKKKKTL